MSTTTATSPELRNAVRFPIQLPVAVRVETAEYQATTGDISSGGVLFHMESALEVGSSIEFTIAMPAEVVGTATDVLVNCVGRVVRCSEDISGPAVAAVIDDYTFVRR